MRALLGRRLPLLDGRVQVDGIDEKVDIRRDRFGIPHIAAATSADAFFGLGFCHGQDRPFQLEILLRVGRGTLAEIVGAEALPIDRLSRRIGFWRTAESRMSQLGSEEREALEAYAAGIRQGVDKGLPRLPHPFVLLRAKPTPFEAADSAAVLAVVAFTLQSNWDVELARLAILTRDGPQALAAVDPSYPEWHGTGDEPLAAAGPALDRLTSDVHGLGDWVGMGSGGSNAWAVGPGKTRSGAALVANDPHLAPTLPPHWYLCHMETPHWALAGASFVGSPGVPAGHNGRAAWGVTAGLIDNTDLYIEQLGPDGTSVRRGEEFEQCQVVEEQISVKGGASVTETVLITDRGPVIGPALDAEHEAISLQATWLQPGQVNGLLGLHRVRSFEEFRTAFESWPGAPLSMVYGDTSGTIGWQLVGDTPRRRTGSGTIPAPGWSPNAGWEDDLVPSRALPAMVDPPHQFVATANNRPTVADDDPYLGVDWIDGYRASRIASQLEAGNEWDVATTMDLQLDRLSLVWERMRQAVLDALSDRADLAEEAQALAGWDGVVAPSSEEASLFQLFFADLDRAIVSAKAPRSVEWILGKGFNPLVPHNMFAVRRGGFVADLVTRQPADWFPGSWADQIALSMDRARRRLQAQQPDGRPWGTLRPLILRHPLGSRQPMDRVYNLGPIAWGGDANTVGQSAPDPARPDSDVTLAIASLRMVVDLSDFEKSRFVLPGGQSGNPFSRHYDDQLEMWTIGDGAPIAFSAQAVAAATHHYLALLPD